MLLDKVMEALAARLSTIDGLDTYPYPPDDVPHLPAAVVELPEGITYDQTYGRGSDVMTLNVRVVVARPDDRSAWQRIAPFADGAGSNSVKAVLESGTYTAFGTVRVTGAAFGYDTIAGAPVLAGLFTLEISGEGE